MAWNFLIKVYALVKGSVEINLHHYVPVKLAITR